MRFIRPTAAVRTEGEIAVMRHAGAVVAEMHRAIRAEIAPGVSTLTLDHVARQVLSDNGATSNFLGYGRPPYPAVICASRNEMVVHGVPSADDVLAQGDIISIDCGAVVDGWHGDAAFTAGVGDVDDVSTALIATAEAALAAAIEVMVPDGHLGDIGDAVEKVVDRAGLEVVDGYTGHAIGQQMHEPPNVPNRGRRGSGQRLKVGNVLAIEPMVAFGTPDTVVLDDGWSVVTANGARAAHAEHTVAITEDGPTVLTLPADG